MLPAFDADEARTQGGSAMQSYDQMLLNPSFAKDPPVKINVPAKTLGIVYAVLAAIGAFFGLLGILGLIGLTAVGTAVGAFAGLLWLAVLGLIVSEVGSVLVAWGGYQMYQLKRDGKRIVVYGLVLSVVGGLISSLGGAGDLVGWVISAAISFVFYYLVIISRFPDEPPLVVAKA
jgi:hypothetical protein